MKVQDVEGNVELFGMHDAKTHLSQLIQKAAAGQAIVITNNGKPVARIVPYEEVLPARRIGFLEGRVDLTAFDSMDAEVQKLFEGTP